MFNYDLTLAGTSTSKTYSLVDMGNRKATRADATAPLGEPRTLVISHQPVTRSYGTADRHLVRFDDTITGVAPASDPVASVQLVTEVPRDGVTAAQIKDIIARLVSFLGTSGYIDKLLNSEP